jgi:hypothetical protein
MLYGLSRNSCHNFWVCCMEFPALNVPRFLCQTASKCMHLLCCTDCTFLSCTTSPKSVLYGPLLVVPSASILCCTFALECVPMLNNFLSSLLDFSLFSCSLKNSSTTQNGCALLTLIDSMREGERSSNPMVEIRRDEWWRLNHLTHPLSLSSKSHLLIYIS